MHPTEVVLSAVGSAGRVPGRTSLQKICYFLEGPLATDLGFRPHYYGPFSTAVSEAADNLVMAGLLNDEVQRSFRSFPGGRTEWEQHNYSLTDEGIEVFADLQEQKGAAARRVAEIIGILQNASKLRPAELSLAAKYHFLRQWENVTELPEMVTTAAILGWQLTEQQLIQGKELADAVAV